MTTSKIKMTTNKEHIQSMNTEDLARYLARINDNGYSVQQLIDWLGSIYMSDRIDVKIPGRKYTGDFEGEAHSWDEAYKREMNWLREHGYLAQDNIDEQGKGAIA